MNDLSPSAYAKKAGARPDAPPPKRRLWRPILAGATIRERLLACLGAVLAIGLTGLICAIATGGDGTLPLIVAPMGASAVLVFAVPTSPLAQPWPVIGGNVISAMSGLAVVHVIPDPVIAAGFACGLAILLMSALRCLHPPGGAAALVAALGGPGASAMDLTFPLIPVGLNAIILAVLGIAFHRACGRAYPHRAVRPGASALAGSGRQPTAARRIGFRPEDIDVALDKMGETFDISPEDLGRLLHEVELSALVRANPDITCADIMTRDVITINRSAHPSAARSHLMTHDIRALPVVDDEDHVLGIVGIKQLQTPASRVSAMMDMAVTAFPDTPALELIGKISDGQSHTIVVVDRENRLQGIITQTDLLAALATGMRVPRAA